MSSAVVSPKGIVGAAVIGAFVLLRVTVPWAEASIRQNIPLHVHRISNELIKCTCKESFSWCYFELNLRQACSNPASPHWDMAPACISYYCRQPQIYSQACEMGVRKHQEAVTLFTRSVSHTWCPLSPVARTVKICENLLEAQVAKWLKLKMTATNVASVERQDKNS